MSLSTNKKSLRSLLNFEQFHSDGVKARAPKAKAIYIKAKAKAVVHKAKDKVINRDKGQRQGHDEPTQYHFLWRKCLPVTNIVY